MAPTILVIGGSRGIGAAIVELAAEKGYDVAFTYNNNAARAEDVAGKVRALGRKVVTIKADAVVEEDVLRTFAEARAALGQLDALVISAGISGKDTRLEDADTAEIRQMLEINTLAPMVHCREAVKWMSTKHGGKGGSIVLISSRATAYGSANVHIWYAASKAAVDVLALGLAREVGGEGIRVNAVSPGPTETDMMPRHRLEPMIQTIALKRWGQPREVAEVALFLASDASSFVTGTNVVVAGGR